MGQLELDDAILIVLLLGAPFWVVLIRDEIRKARLSDHRRRRTHRPMHR